MKSFWWGSSRVPLVSRMVAAHFGREPKNSLDPDEVVGIGAALHAESLFGNQAHHEQHSLCWTSPSRLRCHGVWRVRGIILNRNMPPPIEQSRYFRRAQTTQRGSCPNLPGRVPSLWDNTALGT